LFWPSLGDRHPTPHHATPEGERLTRDLPGGALARGLSRRGAPPPAFSAALACGRSQAAAASSTLTSELFFFYCGKAHYFQMKHIFKIVAILVAISAIWIALLETSTVPQSYTWLLPIYLVVALGCYGLFMVGFGLMFFPTCPQEAVLLQQDIVEAKEFLAKKGVDVGSE
ncbi:unnamed protein product, partial [Urochloa humidicola]